MIKEDYVSFEVAKLLKEKGFDVYGDGSFDSGIEVFAEYSPSGTLNKCIDSKPHKKAYPAPTLQMAIAWILEKYNVSIEVSALKRNCWVYTIYKIFDNKVKELYNNGEFNSHGKAVEAAIKYYIENLI